MFTVRHFAAWLLLAASFGALAVNQPADTKVSDPSSAHTNVSDKATAQSWRHIQLSQFPLLKPVTLASLDPQKPTYIKLWASWCKPCLEQMPHFEQLQQQFGDKVNIVAVNININESRTDISNVIARFKLSMPVLLDQQGQLASALGLQGTPYSVLLNPQGQQVYSSHESDSALDGMVKRLAAGQNLPPVAPQLLSSAEKAALLAPFAKGEQLVFFSATWCDWYLADSRPAMSQQCKTVQSQLNSLQQNLQKTLPQARWTGVVNHLWTDDKALKDFSQQYQLTMPFQIDKAGALFEHFEVRSIPLLLKLRDGKVVARISDFSSLAQVQQQLAGH